MSRVGRTLFARRPRGFSLEALESRRLFAGLAGEQYENPSGLADANGTLLFQNNDGIHGNELWKSDGTAYGTQLVKDINPGSASTFRETYTYDLAPESPVTIGSTTYFSADDGVHGAELWKTSGTAATTSLVADIVPGASGSNPGQLVPYGDSLVFATDPLRVNSRIWKTDGTAKGTVALSGPLDRAPSLLVAGDTIYFVEDTSSTAPAVLWKSNGQPGGTQRVPLPPSIELRYTRLHVYNDQLYFASGLSLYRLDPRTSALTTIYDFPQSTDVIAPIGKVGSRILLAVYLIDDHVPLELWSTDGTAAGTTRLWSGEMPYYSGFDLTPFQITAVGKDAVYFSIPGALLSPTVGTGKNELWKTDGTPAGTQRLKLGGFQSTQSLSNFTDVNGTLYFVDATKLWKSDGTAAGTIPVTDLPYDGQRNGYSIAARNMTCVNGRLFFEGVDPIHESSSALWTYTPGGKMIKLRTAPAKVSASKGLLDVEGTYGNDTVRINANARNGDLTVYWNDAPSQTFKKADVTAVIVHGGDGDDTVTLVGNVPRATVYGDDGSDTLAGGDGDDLISGGNGNDLLRGGAGADGLGGGEGQDTVDYSDRTAPVTVSLDGRRHDGSLGERDNVLPDVENVSGGRGNDLLIGSAGGNVLIGNAGDDTLFGLLGDDDLQGGDGNDSLIGDIGNDTLAGGNGNDTLDAGSGNDLLISDDDMGARDYLFGGKGLDQARADARDRRSRIEQLLG